MNGMLSDNRLWLRNMYLEDKEKAREYIKDKLEYIRKQRYTCIELKDIKYLCRALKSSEEFPNYVTKHSIFIPGKGTLNRWNPPNRIFLYLSCSLCEDIEDRLAEDFQWNQCELTCINEVRAEPNKNVKISVLKFQINEEYKNMKILNLDVKEDYINKIFDEKYGKLETTFKKIESGGSEEMLKEILSGFSNVKNIFSQQLSETTKEVRDNYFIDSIFTPLDDNSDPQVEYKLFHILAEEVEKLGYDGILYPSTRMKLIGKKGTNLVLFDKDKYCFPNKSEKIKHGVY